VFNLPHYSDGDMTNWKAAFPDLARLQRARGDGVRMVSGRNASYRRRFKRVNLKRAAARGASHRVDQR